MKKNIIIAAIAAASALLLCASCQKQELIEQNNGINASGKTFTATIEQGLTKTTITNEYKVNWVEGDQIDINGSIFSATPDASDATKASLTKVSGPDPIGEYEYTAVYPASIMVETQATLPATQTYAAGKFNAPMCAMSSTESLEFKNFCGVLCFALKGTDMVKSIAVTANEQLCGPFEFVDATSFSFSGENEGYTVTLDCGEGVQLSATDSTNFYVYLPPKDSYTAGMKIVVTSTEGKTFEKTTTTAVKIERNNLYTFDWIATFEAPEPEYVEIGGLKWATKNLGAEKVTDYGYYFAWGATELAYSSLSSKTFTFVASRPASYGGSGWTQSSGFAKVNTPYYNGSAYTKYTSSDKKTVLEPGDDAVTALLGSGWRMPTSAEFKALYDACGGTETPKTGGSTSTTEKGVYWCNSYDGVKGLLFCDGTNKLFFPAVGYGSGPSISVADSYGCYWSSSLRANPIDYAYGLYFYSGKVDPQNSGDRCSGKSVRPVKDAAAPLPAGALAGEFSVSATKKVHFSQGNLVATIDASGAPTAWKFSANQYDYIGDAIANNSIGSTAGDIDLFGWSTASTTYGISTSTSSSSYSGDFVDWGKAYCEKNNITPDNTWSTLTKDEWAYLFNTRTDAASKVGYATVGEVNGIIILPDNFTDPMKNNGSDAFVPKSSTGYNQNVYTSGDNWNAMETAGAVFLPAAGSRDGSNVNLAGGLYWSSTAYDESFAYYVSFFSLYVGTDYDGRYFGFSVRLVTDVK